MIFSLAESTERQEKKGFRIQEPGLRNVHRKPSFVCQSSNRKPATHNRQLAASLSVDTARRYLEYLRLSYQTILLQPYFKNITSSVIKTPKLYWLDIGLLRLLSGFRGEIPGQIYETMVVAQIHKWIKTAQRDVDIYLYRTRSGLELDVLPQTRNGIIGMEIKARTSVSPTDYKAMIDIANRSGHEWLGGMIVYQGDSLKRIAEPNIWAIPSRRLFI